MNIKKRIILSMTLLSSPLFSLTLQESVSEVINTNPIVQERLKNFRITQQDLNIAESEYYPQIDLRVSGGYNNAGEISNRVRDIDYTNYESSITLTQNLFDGFGTMHKVDFEESRILAAGYKYIETSNDMAFKMTMAYIDVLKAHKLLQTARENVQINRDIYKKVKELFDSGLTTDSEVKKIESSLSLARSNLTVQRNNVQDKEYGFKRVLGRMPKIAEMQFPNFDTEMPSSIERAALYAIENNPSLLVSRYNIKGSQSLYKQRQKDYYPKLDLIVDQTFNEANPSSNGFNNLDDRFRARVVLTYNLFRGGADKANVQKHISMVNQEIELQRDLKRQVIEGLELSWNSYIMTEAQLVDLREYSKFSETTLDLYSEEYNLGRRTLLDLLTAQNDVINSRSQVIQAEFDVLSARYRILDAMGLLVLAVNGSTDEFTSRVNISKNNIEAKEILDELPVRLDVDNDKIADGIDLCDNSLLNNKVMAYGCENIKRDNDEDGVADIYDRCPLTQKGRKVDESGCRVRVLVENNNLDEDEDEFSIDKVYLDDTQKGEHILTLYFANDSQQLTDKSKKELNDFYYFIKENPEYTTQIVGHTSKTKVSKKDYNIKLSKNRAEIVANELEKLGLKYQRISTLGKGFSEPIADNKTKDGAMKNRRVDILLFKRDK